MRKVHALHGNPLLPVQEALVRKLVKDGTLRIAIPGHAGDLAFKLTRTG